ncbi:MAG: EF-hand domain-containing protein [Deltaproteobacteria bacterium]|nr:EF-hand domain-containing protein [Deltaproteobacteria bacterium]MBW2537532.1 EF-hand domain-containing protein [Deltaproteobacteria bacterium]
MGKGGNRKLAAMRAVERLSVVFTRHIADTIEGRISVELDARLAFQKRPTLERARTTVEQLAEAGVPAERVLVKLPATWESIQAASKLERDGVRCHLTLVFGMHQVAACADAGATVISPAVGRITDWHKKQDGVDGYGATNDPGVRAAWKVIRYVADHGYETAVMPGTFRSIDQALALAGCPLLSLPPKLLDLLGQSDDDAPTAEPASAAVETPGKLEVDSGKFASMHAGDKLATTKLSQGIKNLSWALVGQEKQLVEWINNRQDRAAMTSAAALFRVWDYDNDGYIDREEWGGTDEVFNALDRNNDGRISLEEMAVGLGAPYEPED